MKKDRKQLKSQKQPASQGECTPSNGLFAVEIPVWYEKSGKVNPEWLSICKEERNQTSNNKWFERKGFYSLTQNYKFLHRKSI